MVLQLGLSFENDPFIVHKVARLHRRVLDHQPQLFFRDLFDLCAMILPLPRSSRKPGAENEELLA